MVRRALGADGVIILRLAAAHHGMKVRLVTGAAHRIEILNRETNAGLADPKIEARLTDMGGMLLTGSPADFGKLIAEETEKWGKVIKLAGIKAE